MRLGLDIGGTKIAATVISPELDILWQISTPTPKQNLNDFLLCINQLIQQAITKTGTLTHIGIGIPGVVNEQGVLNASNMGAINQQPIETLFKKYIPQPFSIENDANCFALAQAHGHQLGKNEVMFTAVLGTGVGGAWVLPNRTLWSGAQNLAGEWGHNPLPDLSLIPIEQQLTCQCGQRGCIDTYLSGSGFSQLYFQHTGEQLDAPAIITRYRNQEKTACDVFGRYTHYLAHGLATIIHTFDPTCIVLGGGMSTIQELYQAVPQHWANYTLKPPVTPLLPPVFGDWAGAIGAALLE
ncbi:ROK family protein [Zooshikella harenae]|uniref:ROK family protein n=1 Tax=Zooshikella harenae TaxID=2827238 RepID=A0ABS5Z9K4_9GAMM|nr:ROK family protein [Zooshikella harenae]MBU2710732.1 ROK family protein [Zooshikella harenae]